MDFDRLAEITRKSLDEGIESGKNKADAENWIFSYITNAEEQELIAMDFEIVEDVCQMIRNLNE